jgi:hypothetical protein
MDNIVMTEQQLNQLVDKLAGAMIKRIYGIEQNDARDYEKCAAVKKHLDKVNKIVEKL